MLNKTFNLLLDMVFKRPFQRRLGWYIFNRAMGQGNGDPTTNGEYWLIKKIKTHIGNRPAVIFDVGANQGEWTLKFVEGMSNHLDVYSFEPLPNTYACLEQNLRASNFPASVHPVNAGLGDSTGTVKMYVDVNNPTAGTNSLVQRNARAYGLSQKEVNGITVLRGDDFCADHSIDHIDFMKIDTEGYECSVIKGFVNMLRRRKIDVIQFEYGGTWIDSKTYLADIFDLMAPYEYVICRIHPSQLEVFKEYDQREETFIFANYVAIRKELLPMFDTMKV